MRRRSLLILALAASLPACGTDPPANSAAGDVRNAAPQADPVGQPAVPTVSAPLSRRDLLLAVAETASDFAAGVDDTERQRALDGQPFSFAIRFCEGETEERVFRSSFDEESRVLRTEVRPDVDASSPSIRSLGQAQFEAVEGFWIRRPWLLDAACPAGAPVAPAAEASKIQGAQDPEPDAGPAPVPSSVGLAEFHQADSDRSTRRGTRPYEVTKRLPGTERPGAVDLLIEGRLRGLPGGKVIACTATSPATPPTCIISVRIDGVSLRQPGGEVLAQWSSS